MSPTSKTQGWGRKAKKSNYLQRIMAPEAVPIFAPLPPEPLTWAAERDFTERSLQISASPQLRVRNAKLEQIFQDESILSDQEEDEDASALQLDERETPKMKRDTAAIAALRAQRRSEQSRRQNEMDSERGVEFGLDRSQMGNQGEPITGTPITIFSRPARRAESKREDSHELLRNLSRSFTRSESSSPPKSDVDPEERIVGEARLFEVFDNQSEKGSSRAQTPPPRVDPLTLPTPKVTGAYIETPATARTASLEQDKEEARKDRVKSRWRLFSNTSGETPRPSRLPTRKSPKDLSESHEGSRRRPLQFSSRERPLTNTHLRPSVSQDLHNIIQDAGGDDSTLEPRSLGSLMGDAKGRDSVVANQAVGSEAVPVQEVPIGEGLEEMLEGKADLEKELLRIAQLLKPLQDQEDSLANKHGKGKARGLEDQALNMMDQHLRKTSSSIRDARHGIERLEQQVSLRDSQTQSTFDDSSNYIALKVPRLWRKGQPTWFGWTICAIITWYALENVLCIKYCRDRFGGGSYKDPCYGWVIPTKLDEWTGDIFSSTCPLLWDILEMLATGEESRLLRSGKVLTNFQLDILDPYRNLRNYPGMVWRDRTGKVIN